MKIQWLRFAAEHLDDVYDFLARNNPKAAADLYNDILDEVEKLSAFPQIASSESSLDGEPERFRSLIIHRRYKAIYFIEDETIKVVDVWDCRQNPETLKKKVTGKK